MAFPTAILGLLLLLEEHTKVKLDQRYTDTFVRPAKAFDYALEPIYYPRVSYTRRYSYATIKQGYSTFKDRKIKLRELKPTLLEYHLRQSTKHQQCVRQWRQNRDGEYCTYHGPHWLLAAYDEDALIDWVQIDIDRHGDDDSHAELCVSRLHELADRHGFSVVWTTSPGRTEGAGFRYGLYAWIRLASPSFVFELRPIVEELLRSVGLDCLVDAQEASVLKRNRLVRLPGQYNVEIACPLTFGKKFEDTPVEANQRFVEQWKEAVPLDLDGCKAATEEECSPSLATGSTPAKPTTVQYTYSSVPLSPLTASESTFLAFQRWAREIITRHERNPSHKSQCLQELIETAQQCLPSTSKTLRNSRILNTKAKGVLDYCWTHTNANIANSEGNRDKQRFEATRVLIAKDRVSLLERVELRDRPKAERVLDLLLEYHGRVSVKELYHTSGEAPICGHYREWRRIKDALGLVVLDDYQKASAGRGKCRQYGFLTP